MSFISQTGARRTKAVVERSERGYRNRPPGRANPPVLGGFGVHAKTGVGGIPAATSDTQMGYADVEILIPDELGELQPTGLFERCFNGETGGEISPNTRIYMTPGIGGYTCIIEYGSCP